MNYPGSVFQAKVPHCPECGAELERCGSKRFPRTEAYQRIHKWTWACPVERAEVEKDERGHLHRRTDGIHSGRVWSEDELVWKFGQEGDQDGTASDNQA